MCCSDKKEDIDTYARKELFSNGEETTIILHAGGRNAADKELMNEIGEFLEKTTHIISGDHGFVKTLTYYRDQGSLITVIYDEERDRVILSLTGISKIHIDNFMNLCEIEK